MTVVALMLLGVLVFVFGFVLYLAYPGKPKPLNDAKGKLLPNSLAEKVFVNINGMRQGMFIESADTSNPVLLYLHGGIPDYFLSRRYPTGLEKLFTVVWWEQRGSGLSYSNEIPSETMNADQFISDAIEVTDYLRGRFDKEKIYLMAHSGGTFFGIQTVAQAPELYHAYIGVAQMSNQLQSEVLAYEHMLEQFRTNGNEKMVRKLEAAPVTPNGISAAYFKIRDDAMHTLGIGTMRNMKSVVKDIFIPSLLCRDYTLRERINLWKGKFRSGVSSIWDEIITTDLSERVKRVPVPVYFFHGVHDYTCSYTLAKEYSEKLDAPVKEFYSFTESAHSPVFEEPERTLTIIRNAVLNQHEHPGGTK